MSEGMYYTAARSVDEARAAHARANAPATAGAAANASADGARANASAATAAGTAAPTIFGGEFRAGGTDLQERLRSGVARAAARAAASGADPAREADADALAPALIDLLGIDGLDGIELHARGTTIGALVTVAAIGENARLGHDYPALALPARTIATPQTRNAATLGGVLCQRTRCPYYRHPDLHCPKKGGDARCPARDGDHHRGVCFDFGPCVHPHPSSIGCALLTYEAEVEASGRGRFPVAELYGDGSDVRRDHTLGAGELLTRVHLPPATEDERAAYFRLMGREHAEWPLVEVVARLVLAGDAIAMARVAIGGVANIPFRLTEVEARLEGERADAATLTEAAALATSRCRPLPQTAYKVAMVEASVREALERALGG